uniref:L1 transposable element RRM domain-containing protein n=1 Tax=Sus scrofa TaxID=9823 RepID=A0A8D0XCA9_PIG
NKKFTRSSQQQNAGGRRTNKRGGGQISGNYECRTEKRLKTNEESLRELWDNVKCSNICIIGVPEGEKKEKGTEKILQEIIAENFTNMGKEPPTQIQEAQRVPYKINPRRNTLRHILIKLTKIKNKEKILKASREKKQITYKGTPIRLSADFSAETLQARRECMIYLM